ncbi:hypothetical protein CTI14_40860, partial [Methylobacterium radiotolerans]
MHSERLTRGTQRVLVQPGHAVVRADPAGQPQHPRAEQRLPLNQRGLYIEQTVGSRIEGNTFFRNGVGIELWSNSASQVFKENRFDRNTAAAVLVGG